MFISAIWDTVELGTAWLTCSFSPGSWYRFYALRCLFTPVSICVIPMTHSLYFGLGISIRLVYRRDTSIFACISFISLLLQVCHFSSIKPLFLYSFPHSFSSLFPSSLPRETSRDQAWEEEFLEIGAWSWWLLLSSSSSSLWRQVFYLAMP